MFNAFVNQKLIIGSLLVIFLAWFIWDYRDTKAENIGLSKTLKQAEEIISQQKENILVSERVSNDYQATINMLNNDIKRLRIKQIHCHLVTPKTTSTDGSASKRELPEGNGIRSDWLYNYGARCEAERLKVIGLQNFINRTWEKNQK